MKKVVSWVPIALVLALLSCDIERMSAETGVPSPENEGLGYLTVTYHSEGHTSGEVPVDEGRFRVPRLSSTLPPRFVVYPEVATVMGQGTLEKEGYYFWGWRPRQGSVWMRVYPDYLPPPAKESRRNIAFLGTPIAVAENVILDALWETRPLTSEVWEMPWW